MRRVRRANWNTFARNASSRRWRRTWPHVKEGKSSTQSCCAAGLDYWRERSDFLLIEGAGGLMSPMSDTEYVADLARDFGYPLLIVARNQIGVINQTLQTLIAARTIPRRITVAGIVLNRATPPDSDPSVPDNRRQLEIHCDAPVAGGSGVRADRISARPSIGWPVAATDRASMSGDGRLSRRNSACRCSAAEVSSVNCMATLQRPSASP